MAKISPVTLAFQVLEPNNLVDVKTPIIFLHGLSASKEYWNDIPQTVSEKTGRKVYILDSRNHGDSPWTDVFSFESNVVDFMHFLDTQGIPKATIVGHSMGGITGIEAALKYPDRIDCLVTEDISPKKAPEEAINMVKLFLSLSKAAILTVPPEVSEAEAIDIIGDYIFDRLPPQLQALANKESRKSIPVQFRRTPEGRYAFKANIDVLLSCLKDERTERTEGASYTGPTCFIYGKSSPFAVTSDEEYIKKLFPSTEFVGIENATHTVHTDCPVEFTGALVDFLLKHA